MDTEMEIEGDENPVKGLSEPDAVQEDSDDVLYQIFRILRPLCYSVSIVCERKVCTFDKSEFLRIYNPLSDKHYRYFPSLQLIIFISEGTLGLRLFLEHKKVFKESFVSNIEEQLSNPEEYLGIVTVLRTFLSELSATKYDLCGGAFEESSLDGDHSTVDINSVLIENEDSRIIYRSRKCYLLVKEGTQCNSCAELLDSCFVKEEETIKEEMVEENPAALPNGNLDSFLEMSMEETWQTIDKRSALIPLLKKPKMSYKKLIFSALIDSPDRRLKLTEIYDWILERYPAFTANKNGFQNSIRHNLSLNKMFVKEGGVSEAGRGGYWTVDPHYLTSNELTVIEHCGRPKIQHIIPKGKTELTRNSLDMNAAEISSKGLRIEGIASMIQAKAASTLEAECDPLQVSHPITGKTVVLSSKTSQDEESGISVVKQEDEGVTEPEVTISSVPSTNPAVEESDLAGNHFLYNHLSDKFKLKTILPKPTHASQSQQSELQVAQMGDKISPTRPAPVCRARFAHLSKAENDGVEVSEYYKPCFSYKELIMLAIFSDPSGAICLNDIYMNIRKWFPYFRQRTIGLTWQNSIRHNLSLNKCFWRLDNNGTLTKGGSWSFDTEDETWKKLMSEKKKWTQPKRFQKTFLYELCELLCVRSEAFGRNIFPALDRICPSFYDESEQSQDPLQLNIDGVTYMKV